MNNKDDKRKGGSFRFNIILSILIAITSWVYVVYDVSPNVDKTYHNIPIKFEGEYSLSENEMAVRDATESTVNITVSVKRSNFSKNDEADITAICDVTDAKMGENTFPVTISVPQELTLKSQSIETITINVESTDTKDVPVLVSYHNSVTENSEPMATKLSYENASVFGTKDKVEKVEAVMLVADPEKVSETPASFILRPVAVDADGKIVEHIVVLPSEIEATIVASSTKEIPLTVDITDDSADSKTRTCEFPKKILVKASSETLNQLKEIKASCNITDIEKSGTVKLSYDLPDGVVLANAAFGLEYKVEVK